MIEIILSIILGIAIASVLWIIWFAIVCSKDAKEDRNCVMLIPIGQKGAEKAERLISRFHTSVSFYSELSYARLIVVDEGMDEETRRIVDTLLQNHMVEAVIPREELSANTVLAPL